MKNKDIYLVKEYFEEDDIVDISLIRKYVNGEDIEEYKVEELENDTNFMISVISYTNDYKMYSFCSDAVKKDYKLVKYLVLKFKDKPDFIINVANYFLDNTNYDLEKTELSIIMENVLPQELSLGYRINNNTIYFANDLEFNIVKAGNSDLKALLGDDMPFAVFIEQYKDSDIILSYFARRLLFDMFNNETFDLEKMLHSQFSSAERINEVGINNYILNHIECYDRSLCSYLRTHLDLIKPITAEIKNIQDNWDLYIANNDLNRFNNMLDMVHEYMEMADSTFSENELINYIGNEIRIGDLLKEYYGTDEVDNILDEEFGLYIDDEEEINDMVKLEIESDLKNKLTYLKVKKIMINQLYANKPSDLDVLLTENKKEKKKNTKCKIIKFKPNDNK